MATRAALVHLFTSTFALVVLGESLQSMHWKRQNDSLHFDGAVLLRRNFALKRDILRTVETLGEVYCAFACLSESDCIAQTYCTEPWQKFKGTCYLHKRGIKDELAEDVLVISGGCTYQQYIDFQVLFMLPGDLFTFDPIDEGDANNGRKFKLLPVSVKTHDPSLTPCSNKCHNGQRCSYDFDNRRYACLCEMPYTGMYCEKSRAMEFLFTSLGAQGNTGPTSTAGYKHTPLQGTVTLNKGIQIWTVPFTARYCVTVVGASGGNGLKPGGKGAIVSGIVRLIKGTVLHLLIGQKGVKGSSAAGGGGGTFVVFSNNTLIAAAGGGGGGGGQITSKVGDDGQKGRKGSIYGGVNGLGGKVCANESNNAGGGGGFRGDGKCSLNITCVSPRSCKEAGMSYLNGGVGGEGNGNGGFGGGGAAFKDFAGGGGGYSGGGVHATSFASRTGGGGSFDDGVPVSSSGVSHNSADGYVSFRYP